MKLLGLCRGNGAAYFAFASSEFTSLSDLSITANSRSGNSFPVDRYFVDFKGDQILIACIPLFDDFSFELTILDRSVDSVLFRKNFNSSKLKWLSRLNYKINADLAYCIRDIEKQFYSNQIHLKPTVMLESSDHCEWIVKGVACYPSSLEDVNWTFIDSDAVVVDAPNLLLGSTSDTYITGVRRVETAFTLRFPRDDSIYCLAASSDSIDIQPGFISFDSNSIKLYTEKLSPYFYGASSPDRYTEIVNRRRDFISVLDYSDYRLDNGPLFSIIVPLYKTPLSFLNEMVESVRGQIYSNWELLLVNASPDVPELSRALTELDDHRIKVVNLESNLGIAENTNAGIRKATGDYIVFFDHDDTLDPFALYEYAKHLNESPSTDALYCDEDFLNEEGEYVAPHFKSDFNLDLLRVHNYITHLLCVRSSLVKELMLRKEFDGAQDYDFLLRLVEKTQEFHHVHEVLYHWRISDTSTAKSAGNKNYADEAGRKALQEHIDRLGLPGKAECTDSPCFYHVSYDVVGEPLVSIIIPNKDSVEVLSRCIDSIEHKSAYRNFEILIVENNSVEKQTFSYYESVTSAYDNVDVVTWCGPFNYSAINNYGVRFTHGEYLLFLNNDTEVIEPHWIDSMLGFCQREDVGAVGAKLLYPDNTVQHAGVMMIKCEHPNEMGGPIHVFNNLDRDDPGYMRRASISQDLSAVTAACMMTKRSVYEQLDGFNEDFVVAFNDVDFCLRVRETGYLVVFDADALLYHYESFSRGYETGEKVARFMREQGKLRTAWAEYYVDGDPYHSAMSTQSV